MKRYLTGMLLLLVSLMLLACGGSNTAAPSDAATNPEEPAKQVEQAAEAAEEKTAEPTSEPTPEPTEEPTPAPTEEPEYWKYVQLREELKGAYSSTEEAWEKMVEIYKLEKELDTYVCGLFQVDWDTHSYDYTYRLDGIVNELIMMAKEEEYADENSDAVMYTLYEPQNAEVVAPGVIRVAHNPWLDQLPDYPPLYFISLESEDPASGWWIAAYQDVPETVLHPASVSEEKLAELKKAVQAKKVAESGLVLSEGELVIDGVDYKALRNRIIENYQSASAAHSALCNKLDAAEKNQFDKTPNAVFFVNWANPNYMRWTGWYMNEAMDVYNKLRKNLKKEPTAEQIMPMTFYPDKVEKLDDYIYRSTTNDWMKKTGGEMIWLSLDSDDPASGYWIGFYGPVPDLAWE